MKKVSSIKEYIECIEQIRKRNTLRLPMVFRGQGNSEWPIRSTLERAGIDKIFSKEYYKSIDYLKPEINSLGCAKKEIIAELYKMNINHYTLYLDEDSLIRKLKYEFLQSMKND